MTISVNVYRSGMEVVVAACDSELLGKKYREGQIKLEVSSFYEGALIDEEALPNFLKDATIVNLVGERSVACAADQGYIDPDCVMKIEGVPHVQIFTMQTC